MRLHVLLRIGLFSALVFALPLLADPVKPDDKAKKSAASAPADLELRLADNSTLKATLLDAKIDVMTRYGRLSVPTGDIQRIDFSPRPTPEEAKKLEAAIAALASPSEKQRESAASDLISLREMSYPPLLKASKSANHELAARVREVIDRLREALGEDKLTHVRDEDVVQTEGFTVVGRIETPMLRVKSRHFGELQLKIADIRGLSATNLAVADAGPRSVDADPGSLVNYEQQIGKTFYFRVTGAPNGSLWGTETYTTDSTLAAAAVHSGILKVGQTGVVKVLMQPSPPAFVGSTQNGLSSSGYGAYRASFKVSKP